MKIKVIKKLSCSLILIICILAGTNITSANYMGKGDNSSVNSFMSKNQYPDKPQDYSVDDIIGALNFNFGKYPLYTVREGDTLWLISKWIGSSINEIKTLNSLKIDSLNPGQILKIDRKYGYKIKKGDTLWLIAKNKNVNVHDLKVINNLHSDVVYPEAMLLLPAPYESKNLVEYRGNISHIFFHALIAFPGICHSNYGQGRLDADCVTVTEFKRTLNELYKNNYVLVDIHSSYEIKDKNGKKVIVPKNVFVPKGKKPLILSVDDMVYDYKKKGWGMVDKIIMDQYGRFATYTKHYNGKEVISYDNEILPILDQFIKVHPDFSVHGAKATLAMTGFAGVLGYRTDRLASNRASEITAAKPIINRLKQAGYTFASHGYGHRHTPKISYDLMLDDTKKWRNEVESLVGFTNIYIYPYGEAVFPGDAKYSLLLNYGFNFMCGVAPTTTWSNLGTSLFMTRQGIDGYSLRNFTKYLAPLFDTKQIIDKDYRLKN